MNQEQTERTYSGFWPLALIAVSFAALLAWQVTMAGQQYLKAIELRDQQAALVGQAAQAEARLKDMMMELLELAKTDPEAQTIIKTHRITYNPPLPSALDVAQPQPARRATNAPALPLTAVLPRPTAKETNAPAPPAE